MIEWELGADALRVGDVDNTEVVVHGDGLDDADADGTGIGAADVEMPRPVDETVAVTTTELRVPHAVLYAFSLDSDTRYELPSNGTSITLPADEYVVDVDAAIKLYLRFRGQVRIDQTDGFESIVFAFPERTRVVLGFRSRSELPVGTITVPDRPEDVAEAIAHLGAAHRTDGPDRTYPTLRGHPALLEPGDELDVPDCVREDAPQTGIELVVPPRYESLFVTAPLAYSLQTAVRTRGDVDGARVRLTDFGIEHSLSPLPALEDDVARLLRKTFFLDCLVRNAGPYGTNLAELNLLETLELDAATLYEASPQERLAQYLGIPFEALEHRLPEWHLATYVTPDYDSVETLPFLLDRMSLVYRPRTTALEGKELVERSLEDFYRGYDPNPNPGREHATDAVEGHRHSLSAATDGRRPRASTGQVASVDIVKPELRHGRTHGWLADGVPIDVFKSAPAAYRNRLEYLERAGTEDGRDATSIRVVLNDPEMAGEHEDVARTYRNRAAERPMDVTVEESLDTAALARLLEDDTDFVHYIGHCETGGLRCPDGTLSVSSLDRCGTQTFFLNACGSFYEGRALVEKGSVAGAVTVTAVLNDHAIKVGSAFARFLVYGFSIERAMNLARRRIMMGKDYAVVGDGTHSLTRADHRFPTTVTVDPVDGRETTPGSSHDSRYLVTVDCFSTQTTGSYYVPHTGDDEYASLCGNESRFVISKPELTAMLAEMEAAVIYDGDVYWSRDLSSRLDR